MTHYRIINSERLDNHAVVQCLEDIDGIPIGVLANISNLVTNTGLNGNSQLIVSLQPYRLVEVDDWGVLVFDFDDYRPNQIILENSGVDLDRASESAGRITYEPTITWITAADVQEWLGISVATANDTAYLATCTSAANTWCYRRRVEAGYHDDVDAAPDDSVFLGTVMYAGGLYRERGSVDSFSSFEQQATGVPFGSLGRIKQLLGVDRPSIG